MEARVFSTRLFQMMLVTIVLTMFLYLIFQAGLQRAPPPSPDFSWLSSRNVSTFVRPEETTALAQPPPCRASAGGAAEMRLLVIVHSSPENSSAR